MNYKKVKSNSLIAIDILFKEIKGISFDLAKTLIFASAPFPSYQDLSDLLTMEGYEIYPQELEAARQYVFFIDFPKGQIDTWKEWTKKIFYHLGYSNVNENIIKKFVTFMQEHTNSFKLFDEVLDVVESLFDMNLKLSIVTTIPEFKFTSVIDPIRKYFGKVVTGANAKCAKGNPKMYQYDLNSKELMAGQNLFVGDDLYFDIKIPKQLGQITAYINREGDHFQNEYADYYIKSLRTLVDIIKKANTNLL